MIAVLCRCGEWKRRLGQRNCLACHADHARRTRRRHGELAPEPRRRANCRSYTNVLVRRGQLAPAPCLACGAPDAQAHHLDYDNPRSVEWFCRECHLQLHVATPPAGSPAPAPARSLDDVIAKYL